MASVKAFDDKLVVKNSHANPSRGLASVKRFGCAPRGRQLHEAATIAPTGDPYVDGVAFGGIVNF